MKAEQTASIIEWVSAKGYIQKVAGNWVDDRGDTVARDTAQLIDLYMRAHQEEDPPLDKPIKKVRAEYHPSDWNGGQVGRKPLPKTIDRYNLAKARKPSRCHCCKNPVERGAMKWSSPNSDVCIPCFRKWKEVGGILEKHPLYKVPDSVKI